MATKKKTEKKRKVIDKEIELGDTIRDKISGVTGIATSRTEFLNGCVQYSIGVKTENVEELMTGEIAIDEQQLEVLEKVKGEYGYEEEKEKSRNGGPKTCRQGRFIRKI